jgi:hypothetical protein
MTGPTGMGVDDILRTFEEARRAEMSAQPQPATGFATQPAVAAAMNSSASIADDMSQSHAESTATGTGRRKKRSQPPVGSTVILNV